MCRGGLLVAKANKKLVETPPTRRCPACGPCDGQHLHRAADRHHSAGGEPAAGLIRVALGLAVYIWLAVNLFVLRRDIGAYRTWFYLGLVLLPLSVVCAVTVR